MPEIEIASPKMLREAACQLEHALTSGQYVPGAMKTESMANQMRQLIDAIDKVRPLGVDGKHGDQHTADCGCEDKHMNFCVFCKQRVIWGFGHDGWHWFHVDSESRRCDAGELLVRLATPIEPIYEGKEHL